MTSLNEAAAAGFEIKPLEWEGSATGCVLGIYHISIIGGDWELKFSCFWHAELFARAKGTALDFETALVEAKAAAQADFNQRIRSAIVSLPTLREDVTVAEWEDPQVKAVYELLCDQTQPPADEHWEGFAARRIVAALRSASKEPEGWLDIATSPKDGTCVQARIPGHGSDNVIAWSDDLMNSAGGFCGGWNWMGENEPPDSWTDGVCWAVNADDEPSVQPTHWRPLHAAPKQEG